MDTKRQETPQGTLWNGDRRPGHQDDIGATGSQEQARTTAGEEEGEKREKMSKSRVISKSVIRRIGAQVGAPDGIRQRSMEMRESNQDAALLLLKCWRDLQHVERHAAAELEECDTLEELQAWRRKWIGKEGSK